MRVHQSMLDDCMFRMQLKLETSQYFGGSVRALGSGYHKALEIYYLHRMEHGFYLPHQARPGDPSALELVAAARDEFDMIAAGTITSHVSEETKERGGFIWNSKVPDPETAHAMLAVMVESYFAGEVPGVWPLEFEILGVEQFFELPWKGDDTRGGSIDLILRDPNGWIIGDDHKTAGRKWNQGKEKPRKNIQAPWYNWAISELHPGAPGYRSTFSIMTYTGVFERRISDPGPEHIEAAERLLSNNVALYKTARANGIDMPANPSSTLCSPEYCDFWNQCPHGAVLD